MEPAARMRKPGPGNDSTYLEEISRNWRLVLAASIGQAAGYSLVTYISNIFTPYLLSAFGWSRSAFALVGMAFFFGILIQPVTGRLGDLFGVRRVAIVGIVGGPLVFIGFSLMTGALWQFFVLTLLHLVLTSGATGPVIYSRLIAKNLQRARGFALAVAATTPAVVAAICVPFLSRFIASHGWRLGYVALALSTAIGGLVALFLIPPSTDVPERLPLAQRVPIPYGSIVRSRSFQLIIGAVFLGMLSFTLQTTQLKVVLLDRGIDSAKGSLIISLFVTSTIVGRLLSGLALDRLPAYAVAAVFLGLPGVGLSILAIGATPPLLIAIAVALLGISLGAEGDVWAYLIAKYFRPEIYGTVFGLVLCGMALSAGGGALLLSLMLRLIGGFTPFLILCAVAVFSGSALLMLLGRETEGGNEKLIARDPIHSPPRV